MNSQNSPRNQKIIENKDDFETGNPEDLRMKNIVFEEGKGDKI